MNQLTFFEAPEYYQHRVQELTSLVPEKGIPLTAAEARTLLNVELTFALAELLGFDDEPVTAPWALLSGMPLREMRLQHLNAAGRRAVANARQLLPYGPRFAWLAALRDYLALPAYVPRGYDFELANPSPTIIANAKKLPPNRVHAELYRRCLTEQLPWRQRPVPKSAQADTDYQFRAVVPTDNQQPLTAEVQVRFSEAALIRVPALPPEWLPPRPAREPLRVTRAALEIVAADLDQREARLARRYPGYRPQGWVARLGNLTLQLVQAGQLQPTDELTVEGFMHLAGMVASGKSTLATLLAAYFCGLPPGRRITLVVGDVQSAVGLANQLNTWFTDDPEANAPVAVPLLGRSTRETHRRAFAHSDDYSQHLARSQPHWGERWLSPLCPLQACLTDNTVVTQLEGNLLPTGREPCQRLYKLSSAPAAPSRRGGRPAAPVASRTAVSCPFLASCPQYQLYRDMPIAAVWITTPGGLTSGSLPAQFERRHLKIGELVYEQSDLVIFDEADTIIKWLDDHYAQEVKLTGGQRGLFDTITLPTERHTIQTRVMPPGTQRWVGAERAAQQVISSLLTLLTPGRGPGFLQHWVASHQFTPLSLSYRLARAIAGLDEYDKPDVPEAQRQINEKLTRAVLHPFEALLDEPDPLRPLSRRAQKHEATRALWQLLQRLSNAEESASDTELRTECATWLRSFGPSNVPGEAERPAAEMERLAYQLQLVLTVALLDRHSRIVFYEWDQRPAGVVVDSANYRSRAAMQSLLPLPLTGRQFGTYYASGSRQAGATDHALSLFAYTNVGRYYVLHFHELFADLTGEPGPHVLALSGTSYLPDSTTFHVGPPQGLLSPPTAAMAAIARSKFAFLPQRDAQDKGIRISGGGRQIETMSRITQLMKGLAGRGGQGHLAEMLDKLHQLGQQDVDQWADRDRLLLLVNSYDQAHWAADALRNTWPAQRTGIRYLVRQTTDKLPEGGLLRADIEQFAHQPDARVLIAPLNAIGRGFNILNTRGRAAFGAVYFLTRPYPHPHDAQAVARELNRRTFDWLHDETQVAWEADGLLGKADAVRRQALRYWRQAESRSYYSTLYDEPELGAYPRRDLAATTLGYVIQAVGRLLRGGVPFHAFFVDAAWAPNNAAPRTGILRPDAPENSLLAAMIERLRVYTSDDDLVGRALYQPLQEAMEAIEGFVE